MLELQETNIKDMIYTIRGQQVMLDSDLARLYNVTTGNLNKAVKRNIERFPDRFRFQITKEELNLVRFQNGISLNNDLFVGKDGGRRYLPYVFTEQGTYQLSSVLKSDIAAKVSVSIMDAFVEMRHYLLDNKSILGMDELVKLSWQTNQNTVEIIKINNRLENVATKDDISKIMDNFIDVSNIKEFVFVDGPKFEADEAYIKLYKLAKKSIYVVDDYVSIKTLSHLKHKEASVNVILFTDNKSKRDKLQQAEVTDFTNEYPLLEIRETDGMVHDRLIVIDYGLSTEKIYLCGASSKDAGAKFCTILEVHNKEAYHPIVDALKSNNLLVL